MVRFDVPSLASAHQHKDIESIYDVVESVEWI